MSSDLSYNENSFYLSKKYILLLNIVFYCFGLICNGAGFFFSGIKPTDLYGDINLFTAQLCHIITGIGFCINSICCILSFTTKKFSLFDTITILFTGYILFPCIMLTSSDPNETITYQFILPALYTILVSKNLKKQIILSFSNMVVLCVVDYIQFSKFESVLVAHTINMVVIFVVIYITSTLISGVFAMILKETLEATVKLKDTYKKLARTDPLTGLYNRFGLEEAIDKNKPAIAAMIDIDFFKKVNDTFGHQIGDHILLAVADTLKSYAFDNKFYVSRYGGEEFLIISHLSEKDTLSKCKSIKSLISTRVKTPDSKTITVSIGVSRKGVYSEELIKDAGTQLYLSKENGRDRITVHE